MSPTYEGRRYDDMLRLIHHSSATRPRMSMHDRAAQFAPFAALTGHDAAIRETARRTEVCPVLDETAIAALNRKLQFLLPLLSRQPEVTLTYFRPDDKKDGGALLQVTGLLKKLDPYAQILLLADGTGIPMDRLLAIDSPLFANELSSAPSSVECLF